MLFNLNVIVRDNSKKTTEYFNYIEGKRTKRRIRGNKNSSDVLDKIIDRIEKEDKEKHNPIKTISDIVLDSSDGDFSLKINGKNHNWISDDTVIMIADYIEKQLNKDK